MVPVLRPDAGSDLFLFYLPPARVLAAGQDPYASCGGSCFSQLSSSGSLYPPLVPWLFRPAVGIEIARVDLVAMVAAQLLVAALLLALLSWPRGADPQLKVLLALAVVSYPPLLTLVHERQLHLLVVLAAAAWLAAWVRGAGAVGAGLLLGLAAAVKLLTAPLLLLAAWGRRWVLGIAGLLAWLALWLLAEPRLLPEYLLRVFPAPAAAPGRPRTWPRSGPWPGWRTPRASWAARTPASTCRCACWRSWSPPPLWA